MAVPLLVYAPHRCLTAMARFKEAAPALLQRLLAAAVVNGAGGSMEFKGGG